MVKKIDLSKTMDTDKHYENFFRFFKGEKLVVKFRDSGDKEIFIEDFLGAGGMGAVLRAKFDGKNIAAKILAPDLADNPEFSNRFKTEAEIMRKLPKSPYIVNYYFSCKAPVTDEKLVDLVEVFFRENYPPEKNRKVSLDIIAMEYVDGLSLDKRERPIPIDEACSIVEKVGEALVLAHGSDFIHRDIKPGNIIIASNGDPKLTDFGLGKVGGIDQTAVGMAMGTPLYMSPEHTLGTPNDNSDQYSLGATLYSLVTGRPPIDGSASNARERAELFFRIKKEEVSDPRKYNPLISSELAEFIMRSLAKDWKQRFLNMKEFVSRLNKLRHQKIESWVQTEWETKYASSHKSGQFKDVLNLTQEPQEEGQRKIISECYEIERNNLETRLFAIDPNHADYDDLIALVRGLQRWLDITPRTEKNVNQRVNRIEDLIKVSRYVSDHYNRNFESDRLSAEQALEYEKQKRKSLGVPEPELPKTWRQRYGWYMAGAAIVVLASLASVLGFLHVKTQNERLYEKQKQEATLQTKKDLFEDTYQQIEKNIENDQFDENEELFKKSRSIAGSIGDSGLERKVDELEARSDKKKEERKLDGLYLAAKTKIDRAYSLVDESEKESDFDNRLKLLQSAMDMISEVEVGLGELRRENENELRQRARNLEDMIGPEKRFALMVYGQAQKLYSRAVESYEGWSKNLEEGGFFERAPLVTLQKGLSSNTNLLEAEIIKKYFRGSGDEYDSFIRNIKVMEKNLLTADSRLSIVRFGAAKTELESAGAIYSWLEENYFTEDAAKKIEEGSRLISSVETHLNNTNELYVSLSFGMSSLENLKKTFNESSSNYQSIQKKIQEVEDLRRKAKAGDSEASLVLGELLFEKGYLGQARIFFEAIKSERSETYIQIINLEDELKKPENLEQRTNNFGYSTGNLAEFDSLIKNYDGNNEAAILAALKEVKQKNSAEVDIDRFGELHEDFVLGREGARERVDEYLRAVYQAVETELKNEEPEILKRRRVLYEKIGREVPAEKKEK